MSWLPEQRTRRRRREAIIFFPTPKICFSLSIAFVSWSIPIRESWTPDVSQPWSEVKEKERVAMEFSHL